jgi:hypothetical protein
MRQAVASDPPPVVAPTPIAALTTRAPRPEPAARPAGFYAATRTGKKKVTAALDPAAHKQLKGLAVERDATTEALIAEAINDLFRKYGKPSIA